MKKSSAGFTLTEALIAVAIGTIFLGTVLSVWYFTTLTYKEENTRSEMRYGIEKGIEKMKEDIRLADGNNMLFYPSTSPTYMAVSMPHATQNGSGFYSVGTTITWDTTVCYHVYNNSGTYELRRTVFNSFNASAAARQTQLNNLAATGSAAGGTTTTVFKADNITLEIIPVSPSFDGYNATPALSASTSFGSLQVTSGTHNIRFIVSDKNTASSGYRLGIDQLTLSPSGGGQEAEVLTVSADNGRTKFAEDMTPYAVYGSWFGNYQKEYQATAVNDYIQFQTYYDQWQESNFSDMTHANTEVTFADPGLTGIAGMNPVLSVATRENQSLVPAWKADSQTGGDPAESGVDIKDMTVRSVIAASSIALSGNMVRFKFEAAPTSGGLGILSAYFGARSAGTSNFSGVPTQLYFNNGYVADTDTDGIGAVGVGGPTNIDIPVGCHAWTNWMTYTVTNPSATDYLVSFAVDNPASSGHDTVWDAGSGTHSYREDGNAPVANWAPADAGYATDSAVHAVAEMSAWTSTGTAASQIYDTKMTAPVFGNLSWATNGSGTYAFKVRASNDSQMIGATDWSALATYPASPATPAISSLRYVQWEVTMAAASPYTTYPQVDNVTLQWPGQTAIVDFSGYYTKRPNYGMFTVQVDGQALVNALKVDLEATKTYQGRDYSVSLSAEVKARNTGK